MARDKATVAAVVFVISIKNTAMRNLILFRGLPGSGKSILSAQLCTVTLSADDYFIGNDGMYRFDASHIRDAHQQCQSNVAACMRLGMPSVGVANTFTQAWEMKAYFDLAAQHDYHCHTIVVENRHGSKSTHAVPPEVYKRMAERFELQLIDQH